MDPKQHWESIYQTRDPTTVSWFQPDPRLSLQLITEAAPNRTAAILDVGGELRRSWTVSCASATSTWVSLTSPAPLWPMPVDASGQTPGGWSGMKRRTVAPGCGRVTRRLA